MSSIFWKFATHAAEVEVDVETGIVKMLRFVAAHDMGKAINPIGCEQQIEGAVIMGISNTLFEEFNEQGMTIIMVTHDPEVAERAQRIIWLRDGLVIEGEA